MRIKHAGQNDTRSRWTFVKGYREHSYRPYPDERSINFRGKSPCNPSTMGHPELTYDWPKILSDRPDSRGNIDENERSCGKTRGQFFAHSRKYFDRRDTSPIACFAATCFNHSQVSISPGSIPPFVGALCFEIRSLEFRNDTHKVANSSHPLPGSIFLLSNSSLLVPENVLFTVPPTAFTPVGNRSSHQPRKSFASSPSPYSCVLLNG